ncbi:MAG: hypothetical protein ACK5MP_08270 [Nostocoides sp.]
MLVPLTTIIVVVSVLVVVLAGLYALMDRLINDVMLLLLAVLEVGAIVQAVIALARLTGLSQERATFAAYALTLPSLPLFAGWLAIKEKSRWAMATIAVGALAVGVMSYRMQQIWSLHA